MEKYSYHEIRDLLNDGSLVDIQKVSEDIGLNTVVRQDKWTLLHAASATNRPDVAQYLINEGSDVNVLDKEGKSPLYYCQSVEVAKMMVDAGAEVNHPSILGKTPLHYACISNASPPVVELLLQSGARVNAEDKFGNTPFLNACDMAYGCIDEEEFANNLPKINILIEHGADVHHNNSKGENGLHVCSRYHTYEIVEILLIHGVEVNALIEKHQTPLAMACFPDASALNRQKGILTTLEVLLGHGADPMIPDDQLLTPLHLLMFHHCDSISETDIASVIDVLLKRGASLNARDNMLRTPMHYASYAAAHGNWPGILEALVSLGGDINLQDVEGFTPVHVTATRGPSRFSTSLWPWDCIDGTENVVQEINWDCARKHGVTLAHMVLANKGLHLQGSDVPWNMDARDEFMSTPMHYAEFSNNTLTTWFLKAPLTTADVTLEDCLGKSPIDWAVSALNQEMLELIENYGRTSIPEKEKTLPDSSCGLCARFAHEGIHYRPYEKQQEPITVNVADVQINPARKMEEYVSHVLHTPRIGKVPPHDAEVVQIQQETENLIREILQRVSDQDRRFRSTVVVAGSVREKTKAGLPNEFDFMCSLEHFSSSCKVIDQGECSPGFVRVKGTDNSADIEEFFDADGHLVPYLVRSKFEQIVRCVMFDSNLWKCCRICSNFILPSSSIGIVHPSPSIIIELCWNGPIYKNMVYSIDLVPVIDAGVFWPKGAISCSPVLENIPKQCVFAMTIPRFERGVFGNEVRISFSLIESAIFDSIPEVVKDAYIAAKAFRDVCPALVDSNEIFYSKEDSDAQSLVPSFWLKMALFHELHKHGSGDESSLTVWVRRIYQRIYQYVCEDDVFPSFFMPQQDFIASKLKGSELKSRFAAEKLEKKLTACKKMCQIIQRFLSSGD